MSTAACVSLLRPESSLKQYFGSVGAPLMGQRLFLEQELIFSTGAHVYVANPCNPWTGVLGE